MTIRDPEPADEFEHPDATREIVFVVEGGRILSVREYIDHERFRAAIADATYVGKNEAVAALGTQVFSDTKDRENDQ